MTKKSDCRLEACRLKSKTCLTFLTGGTIRLKGPTVNNVYGKNKIYLVASVAERLRYRVEGWKVTVSNLGVVFFLTDYSSNILCGFVKHFCILWFLRFESYMITEISGRISAFFLLRKKVTNSWFSLSFYFLM